MHLHSGPVFLRARIRKTRTFKKPPKLILQMQVEAQKNPIHNHATRPHRLDRHVLMLRGDRRKPLCLLDLR